MSDTKLIQAKWILTMDDTNPLLENHAVLLADNKIKAILTTEQSKSIQVDEVIDLKGQLLMPGLVNLHGHSAMTLLRGKADDLVLMDWLNKHIWPAESKFVDDQFVHDGTLIAMAEMLLGGTTTINDMYFYHGSVAKAGIKMGIRTFVGCSILEFPTNYATNAKQYIEKAMNEKKQFDGEALIQFVLAPHAPYTVSDETFQTIVTISEQQNMLVHCHIHETEDEIKQSLAQYQQRPLARLEKLGLLNSKLIAAHMVHLNDAEIQLCRDNQINIAHNPSSNMKLASGFAPIQALLQNQVNVGIATDGAASNNKLDLFTEMHLAALISKGYTQNPTALKAYDVLKMATINGAKALHIDDKIGSIEVGKKADLIAIDLSSISTQPIYDPISHLVYVLGRENVSDVWVDGKRLLKQRRLCNVNMEDLYAKAHYWQQKISSTN